MFALFPVPECCFKDSRAKILFKIAFLSSVNALCVLAVVQALYLRVLKRFLSTSAKSSKQQGMNLQRLCIAFIM